MTAEEVYWEVVDALKNPGAGIRCDDLAGLLTRLGFEIKDCKKVGHKTFFHDGLKEFLSGGYTCGHGRNPVVKPYYIKSILRIVLMYEDELTSIVENGDKK